MVPVDRDICAKTDEPTCQTVAPQEIILQVPAGIEYLARNASQSRPTVDSSLEAAGVKPAVLRATWESDAYIQLLRNAIAWGMG